MRAPGMIAPAGTPCRLDDQPSSWRVGRVKAAAALRAVARSASLDAAQPMGDPAAESTQLLTRLPVLSFSASALPARPLQLLIKRGRVFVAFERAGSFDEAF